MLRGQRSQSEVIGIVLFTAVVVGAVVLVGALVIPTFAEDADRQFLSVDGEATTQNVTLQHADGDSFSTDDLEIILRGNSSSERYDFNGFTQLRGTDNAAFEQGDRWYRSHGIDSDRMEILIVDVSQNQILDRTDVEVTEGLGARFETNRTNPRTVDTIEFDGSGSVAPDGEITNYEWDLGDGTTKSTDSVTHSYDSSGTYDVTLTVETSDGRTASRTKSIQVFEPIPGAAFSFEPQNPDKGEQIEFNASASSSPGTDIDTYAWDFGDGTVTTTSSETITHSYSAYGSYNVSLTVTDGNNRTSTTGDLVSVIDTSKPILNKGNTIVFNDGGVKAIAGNGSNVSSIGVNGSPKALGPPEADLTGNGSVDLPYIKGSSLKLIDSADNINTLGSGASSKPSNQNSLLAVGQWNGSETSVFYIGKDKGQRTIYRVNDSGSVTVVAKPSNGADAIMGTGDIDGDDTEELLFVDGSQQVRYLEPGGTIKELTGGDVGSSSGFGAGQLSDFDNDGTVRAVIVDGNANVKIVGEAEPDTTLSSTNAKKAPVTTAAVDGDSDLEIVYIGSNGNLKYVDDPLGSPTTKFLTDDDGNKISAGDTVGVVSAERGSRPTPTPTSAESIEAVESQGIDAQSSQIELAIENTGSDAVTVVDFAVDATAINNDIWIDDGNNPEFEVSGASENGNADDADRKDNSFLADGTTYRLEDNSGKNATLAATDDSVTVTFRAFGPDDGWIDDSDELELVDNKTDADVIASLGLSDGSTAELYLRVV